LTFVDASGRHDHIDILGLGQVQLQAGVTLILDDFEAIGVFWDVAIQKEMIYMEDVMNQLEISPIGEAFHFLAALQAFEAVTSITDKVVHGYLI
jgi:hypothetical protein